MGEWIARVLDAEFMVIHDRQKGIRACKARELERERDTRRAGGVG